MKNVEKLNVEKVLVPGEAEMQAREYNLQKGVPLVPVVYRSLLDHQAANGLATKIVLCEAG